MGYLNPSPCRIQVIPEVIFWRIIRIAMDRNRRRRSNQIRIRLRLELYVTCRTAEHDHFR
jgi:hypothetical protein